MSPAFAFWSFVVRIKVSIRLSFLGADGAVSFLPLPEGEIGNTLLTLISSGADEDFTASNAKF